MQDVKDPRTWSMEEIWNFISAEDNVPNELIGKVRDGINIKMHIEDIVSNRYTEKPKKGLIIHLGKTYEREDFHNEVAARRKEGIKWILEEFPDKEIAKRRELDTEEIEETEKEEKKEEKPKKKPEKEDEEEEQEETFEDDYDVAKHLMEVHNTSEALETDHVIANRVPLEDRFVRKQHKIVRDIVFLYDHSRHRGPTTQLFPMGRPLTQQEKMMLLHQEKELNTYLLGDVNTTNIISRAREGLVLKSSLKGIYQNIHEKKSRSLRDLIPLFGKKDNDNF